MKEVLRICGNNLRSLSFYGTTITGETLSDLKANLPNLENLDVADQKLLLSRVNLNKVGKNFHLVFFKMDTHFSDLFNNCFNNQTS